MKPTYSAAVAAVIDGDTENLERLLREHPRLAGERSEAEHRATLLHYVAANGVEPELQKVPAQALEITDLLIAAGADPDATSAIGGGGPGSTPLVALVTSAHPSEAGLQEPLTQRLLDAGSKVDGVQDEGGPLGWALEFGYRGATDVLARNGARTDNLVFAAGTGDLEGLQRCLATGALTGAATGFAPRFADPSWERNACSGRRWSPPASSAGCEPPRRCSRRARAPTRSATGAPAPCNGRPAGVDSRSWTCCSRAARTPTCTPATAATPSTGQTGPRPSSPACAVRPAGPDRCASVPSQRWLCTRRRNKRS